MPPTTRPATRRTAAAAHVVHDSDSDRALPPPYTASPSAGSALHTLANVATQSSPQRHGSTADCSSSPVLVVQPAAAAAPPPILSFFPPDSPPPATLASSTSSKAPARKRPASGPAAEPPRPAKRQAAQDSADEDELDDDEEEVEDYVGLLHVYSLPPPTKKSRAPKPQLVHQTGSFAVAPAALAKLNTLKILVADQLNCTTAALASSHLRYRFEKPANAAAKLIINDLDLRSLRQAVEKKRQDIYFHVDKPLNWAPDVAVTPTQAVVVSGPASSSNPLAQMDNNTFAKHDTIKKRYPIGNCADHPDLHCLPHAVSGLHWDVGGDAGLGWAQIAPDNDSFDWLPLGSQLFTARTAIKPSPAAAAAKAAATAAAAAAATAVAAAPALPIPPPRPVRDENAPPPPPANPYHYPPAHYPPPPPHPYAHPPPAPYPPAPAYPPYGYPSQYSYPHHPHLPPPHHAPYNSNPYGFPHHPPQPPPSVPPLHDISNMPFEQYSSAAGLSAELKSKLVMMRFQPGDDLQVISADRADAAGFSVFEWSRLLAADARVRSQPPAPLVVPPPPFTAPAPAPVLVAPLPPPPPVPEAAAAHDAVSLAPFLTPAPL